MEKYYNELEVKINSMFLEIINKIDFDEQIYFVNKLREFIHNNGPFKDEPVDYVKWLKSTDVVANDYNPNKVAPPEMELLELSIINDGYTQPIVTWPKGDKSEVIDGFHRCRVGKESMIVSNRIKGYLPTVIIRKEQENKNDRIASTIRHNRARGKHQIDAMSDIVIELKNRNWKNARIAKELGMDEDEILRLCQITGLTELFKDSDFSKSWEIGYEEDDYEILTDEVEDNLTRTVNTSDPDRIFHTYDKWECHKAGFYDTKKDGWTKLQCEHQYATLLSDEEQFRNALDRVINEWKFSCEHYLTNKAMNRIAWLGQASLCIAKGIPSEFRSGYNLLSKEQQVRADEIALEYLNKWLIINNRSAIEMDEALSIGRQVQIY